MFFFLYRFFNYCDEFDQLHQCRGSREFFFIQSNNNIISYILSKFQYPTTYYSRDEFALCDGISLNEIVAVVIFNEGHIWCVKKFNEKWFHLDSLSNDAVEIPTRNVLSRQGWGRIIVWNRLKSVTEQTPEPLPIPTSRKKGMKKPTKRTTKKHQSDEDLTSTHSLSVLEKPKKNTTNRFHVLSDES